MNPLKVPSLLTSCVFPLLFSPHDESQIRSISCLSRKHWKDFYTSSSGNRQWWEWVATHYYLLHSPCSICDSRALRWWLRRLIQFHNLHLVCLALPNCQDCDRAVLSFLNKNMLILPKFAHITHATDSCVLNALTPLSNLRLAYEKKSMQCDLGFPQDLLSFDDCCEGQFWQVLANFLDRFTLDDFDLPWGILINTGKRIWKHVPMCLRVEVDKWLTRSHLELLRLFFLLNRLDTSANSASYCWIYTQNIKSFSGNRRFGRLCFKRLLYAWSKQKQPEKLCRLLVMWDLIGDKRPFLFRIEHVCASCQRWHVEDIQVNETCLYCLLRNFKEIKDAHQWLPVVYALARISNGTTDEEKKKTIIQTLLSLPRCSDMSEVLEDEATFFDVFLQSGLSIPWKTFQELDLDVKSAAEWVKDENTRSLRSRLKNACKSSQALFRSCTILRELGMDLNQMFDAELDPNERTLTDDEKNENDSDSDSDD